MRHGLLVSYYIHHSCLLLARLVLLAVVISERFFFFRLRLEGRTALGSFRSSSNIVVKPLRSEYDPGLALLPRQAALLGILDAAEQKCYMYVFEDNLPRCGTENNPQNLQYRNTKILFFIHASNFRFPICSCLPCHFSAQLVFPLLPPSL